MRKQKMTTLDNYIDLEDQNEHRKRNGLLSVVALVAATLIGLTAVSGGAFASLDAVSNNASALSVTNGTLTLDAPLFPGAGGVGSGAGFTTPIIGLVPGDVLHRFATYKNSGTLSGGTLSMWITDSGSSLLSSDATVGLKVSVSKCATAWAWTGNATATCTGGATSWLSSTAISTIKSEANKIGFTGSPTLAVNETVYLKFDIQLPDRVERRANGGTPTAIDGVTALTGGTVQGLTAGITWTLFEAQRAASDTNA